MISSESFLQYYGRDLSISAGRGRFQWGPGRFGSLFLNAHTPPFDYVRFDAAIRFGPTVNPDCTIPLYMAL